MRKTRSPKLRRPPLSEIDPKFIADYVKVVKDPIAFVHRAIGAKPQRWQKKVLRDLADPEITRIAVKSCHGPGKTALGAWAILYWLSKYVRPKVPCTAPTEHQLSDVLWPEIDTWLTKSRFQLKRFLHWTKTKVSARDPETGKDDPKWFAAARVSRVSKVGHNEQGEAYGLQGFHADFVLFVIDEASGVPDPVYAAIEGALATGEAKILALGNPNVPFGWFWRAFHKEQEHWSLHTISYKDSPRVSNKWAQSMIDRYGIDHDWVRVRVLGEFPAQAEAGLVPLWAWERCSVPAQCARLLEEVGGRRTIGVDVARYGKNRSVIAYATGPVCHELESHGNCSRKQLVGHIKRAIKKHEPHFIIVDANGPGGDVVDDLMDDGIPNIIPWMEGGGALEPDEFLNARAELAWAFRLAAEREELGLPQDSDAEAQAVNVKYEIMETGKIKIESKEKMAKRMDSPDEFDAIRYSLVPYLVGTATAEDGAVAVPPTNRVPSGLMMG